MIPYGWTLDKPNGFLVHLPSRVDSLGGNLVKSYDGSDRRIVCSSVISSSLSIKFKSRVPVLLLVIFSGASNFYVSQCLC